MNPRIDHDVSMAASKNILNMAAPFLPEEECRDFFIRVMQQLEAAFVARDNLQEREQMRLGRIKAMNREVEQ
jgi:hypothetical protein